MKLARKHAQHALAKVGRDNERGVILSRLNTLLGLLFGVYNGPTQLVVILELVDNLIASVELAHQIVGSALVVVGDSDFNVLGIPIRIPVGNDVVPRIQRWNDADADGDDKRNGIAEQSLDIALEDCEGLFHAEPSNHEFEWSTFRSILRIHLYICAAQAFFFNATKYTTVVYKCTLVEKLFKSFRYLEPGPPPLPSEMWLREHLGGKGRGPRLGQSIFTSTKLRLSSPRGYSQSHKQIFPQ